MQDAYCCRLQLKSLEETVGEGKQIRLIEFLSMQERFNNVNHFSLISPIWILKLVHYSVFYSDGVCFLQDLLPLSLLCFSSVSHGLISHHHKI